MIRFPLTRPPRGERVILGKPTEICERLAQASALSQRLGFGRGVIYYGGHRANEFYKLNRAIAR